MVLFLDNKPSLVTPECVPEILLLRLSLEILAGLSEAIPFYS